MTVLSNQPKGGVVRDTATPRSPAGFMRDAKNQRFARVYQAVDQILNPDVLKVRVVEEVHAPPAWTDGSTITINAGALPPLHKGTRVDLATWIGVNAHELGHTLFTPRDKTPLMARVRAVSTAYPGMRKCLNILEDQRQERLMIAQYPPLKVYLLAAALHFFKREDNVHSPTVWALVAGRTWLDVDIRKGARAAFDGDAGEVARIIGAYQRLGDPGINDADEAFDLAMELHSILLDQSMDGQIPEGCGLGTVEGMGKGYDAPAITDDDQVPSADSDEDPINIGDPDDWDSDDEDDDDPNVERDTRVSRDDEDDADQDDDGGGGEGEDSDDDADDGGGEGGEGGDGEDDADSGGGGDGDSEGDEDAEDEGEGDGSGDSGHTSAQSGDDDTTWDEDPFKDLADQLEDQIRDDLANSKESRQELERLNAALDKVANRPEDLTKGHKDYVSVDHDLARTAHHLSASFKLFTDAAQAYWERNVDSGRINIARYLKADRFDPETGYDRFEPGMLDDLSLEVVVLLDRSASMSHGAGSQLQRACAAAWAIRQAVHAAEGRCTLVGYDTEASLLAAGDQRPLRDKYEVMRMGGGTNPTDAVKYAWSVLEPSDASHRVLVALTDGDWQGGRAAVEAMRAEGVTTIGVLLVDDSDLALYDRDPVRRKRALDQTVQVMGTEYTAIIRNPMDMVAMFKEVATDLMATAKANARSWR